jgi:hypothetical protein
VKRSIIVFFISLFLASSAASQRRELPDLVWSCPMHHDVVEAQKGTCPVCKMNLVPVRLDYIWTCPLHSVIDQRDPGKCPICRRDLVQATVGLTWTCPDRPKVSQVNPGKCADGSAMIERHVPRAHGNHTPQHGGQFFMASDNWHHLEGTHPDKGIFRLHVYDDYNKPLPVDQMKQITGVVTRKTQSFPLKLAADGKALEARVEDLAPPAELVAKVKFKTGGPEFRFDFVFREFSTDPAASLLMDGVPGPLVPIEIPDKTADVLSMLIERDRRIRELIEKGAFGEIYVPAFQAKDLALALDLRTKELPAQIGPAVTAAIERVVRTSWQLDAYGDLGDRVLINEAYATFEAAVKEIASAFTPRKL